MLDKNDLSQIRTVFKEEIRDEVKKVVEDVLEQKLEQKLNKLEKKLDTTINFFDHEILSDRKRIDRIEDKLGIPQPL